MPEQNWTFGDDYPVEKLKFDDFNHYQDFTATTDKAGTALNAVLGMGGEIGEIYGKLSTMNLIYLDEVSDAVNTIGDLIVSGLVCEALKKRTRVDKLEAINFDKLTEKEKAELANEVADVVWYLASFCRKLGQNFGDVMQRNVDKLSSRKERGLLHGSGDNR